MEGGAGSPWSRPAPFALALKAAAAGRRRGRVCVIGGGGTGAAVAYDLALRGFSVVLLERGELVSGTSGRHQGRLQCGTRHAADDRSLARTCYRESIILSRIAGECVGHTGGLAAAMSEEEADFSGRFLRACRESGIPAALLDAGHARALEPALADGLKLAARVPDGTFDPLGLPRMFLEGARLLGAEILPRREVVEIRSAGGRAVAVAAGDRSSPAGKTIQYEADFIVNAAGPWAGRVSALAGLDVPLRLVPGTLLACRGRLSDHVVSRMGPPADGDTILSRGGVSIVGAAWRDPGERGLPDDFGSISPSDEETAFLGSAAARMLPGFAGLPFHAAWTAVRPLLQRPSDAQATGAAESARARGPEFAVVDHETADGMAGFVSVLGGSATLARAMAERTADLVCLRLKSPAACRTADFILPSLRGS